MAVFLIRRKLNLVNTVDRSHIFCPIFMKLDQNMCTNNILDKFENGSGSGVSLSIATVANGSCFLKVAPLFFKVAN